MLLEVFQYDGGVLNRLGWLKFVADFAEGVDEGWVVRVGFYFVSQGGYEAVDAALADIAIVAPDGV